MNILIFNSNKDGKMNAIASAISLAGYNIALADPSIKPEDVERIMPTVVLHNMPQGVNFPIEGNFITKAITEEDLKPFVTLRNYPKVEDGRYDSQVVYIGNPVVFKGSLHRLASADSFEFKFFNSTPLNISGYAGVLMPDEYPNVYRGASVSVAHQDDDQRIMDIVACDGYPVLYKNDDDQFMEAVEKALKDDGCELLEGPDKGEILSAETNFDRAISIFKDLNITKIQKDLSVAKSKLVEEYK